MSTSASISAVAETPAHNLDVVRIDSAIVDRVLDLHPGELVEIRSAAEIAATLDADQKFEGVPFMPEMAPLCGGRFRVLRRADSTCARGQRRQIESTVHLDHLRCDGSAHAGCQAGCLMLWKEAWLRRAPVPSDLRAMNVADALLKAAANEECPLAVVMQKPAGAMSCQATELWSASRPSELGSPLSYASGIVRDYRMGRIGRTDLRFLFTYSWGKLLLGAFKNWAKAPWNAKRYRKTPSEQLDLQPGEWVRVRSIREILGTLDRRGLNKGLEFKSEMFLFCGRKFQVHSRLQRLISEGDGQMKNIRTPCIVLDSVYCHGQRSFCARGTYHYWREIWLRRC